MVFQCRICTRIYQLELVFGIASSSRPDSWSASARAPTDQRLLSGFERIEHTLTCERDFLISLWRYASSNSRWRGGNTCMRVNLTIYALPRRVLDLADSGKVRSIT